LVSSFIFFYLFEQEFEAVNLIRIRFFDPSLSRSKTAPISHRGVLTHFKKLLIFQDPFVVNIKNNEKEERMLSTTLYT
jgi:hypothetical protein